MTDIIIAACHHSKPGFPQKIIKFKVCETEEGIESILNDVKKQIKGLTQNSKFNFVFTIMACNKNFDSIEIENNNNSTEYTPNNNDSATYLRKVFGKLYRRIKKNKCYTHIAFITG